MRTRRVCSKLAWRPDDVDVHKIFINQSDLWHSTPKFHDMPERGEFYYPKNI